jgi:hypothetical protein
MAAHNAKVKERMKKNKIIVEQPDIRIGTIAQVNTVRVSLSRIKYVLI